MHWVWNYFSTDNSKFNGSYKNAWCNAELAPVIANLKEDDQTAKLRDEIDALRDEKTLLKDATEILGKARVHCSKLDRLLIHLRDNCSHATQELKDQAAQELKIRKHRAAGSQLLVVSPVPAHNAPLETPINTKTDHVHPLGVILLKPAVPNHSTPFPPDQQQEFAADLVNVFSACGFAYTAVDHPVLRNFFAKYIPDAHVPSRQFLSGRALDEQVAKAEGSAQRAVKGKLAMGQCDGWKNVTRTPIVGVMMMVENQVHTLQLHDISASRKDGENLVKLMKMNMDYATSKYGVEWIGWCTDAGGDARKARKLAFEAYPWLICPDCWAHQTNLIVGDYFKLKLPYMKIADKAQDIVKWFNNHSRARAILREEQLHTLGKVLALLFSVLTRWTSVYQSLKRLLECVRPLRAIAVSQRDALIEAGGNRENAPQVTLEVLRTLNDDEFWAGATRMVSHLGPLTIAAHVTQGASTRLDHVLLTLANLYRLYSNLPESDVNIRKVI